MARETWARRCVVKQGALYAAPSTTFGANTFDAWPRVDQVRSKSRKTEKIISNGVAPRRFDSTRLRCPLRDNNSEAEQV
jgi:hypothetical protein